MTRKLVRQTGKTISVKISGYLRTRFSVCAGRIARPEVAVKNRWFDLDSGKEVGNLGFEPIPKVMDLVVRRDEVKLVLQLLRVKCLQIWV